MSKLIYLQVVLNRTMESFDSMEYEYRLSKSVWFFYNYGVKIEIYIASSLQHAKQLSKQDLKQVRNFLHDIRHKWYDLGIELNITPEDLDDLKSRCSTPVDFLREMIRLWLKSVGPPTWKVLANALGSKAINEVKLAQKGGQQCNIVLLYYFFLW